MSLHMRDPMPALEPVDGWVDGRSPSTEDLSGHVVLVHFWGIGCETCEEQLPSVARWERELGRRGLRVLGVHVPVAGAPLDVSDEDIAEAARAASLRHPIAVDRSGDLAERFELSATPTYFVFDESGALRHRHTGAEAEASVEAKLRKLLAAAGGSPPGPVPP